MTASPTPTPRRGARRRWAALSATALLAPLAVTAVTVPAEGAASTLGGAAATTGRYVGVALSANRLAEADYVATADREFTSVTPENEMKWDATEPRRGQFTFAAADRVVAYAEARDMEVRGHTLVWHSQLPSWVTALSGATEVRAAMNDHITGLMSRYKGRIAQWDVVNEAFDDSGTGARRQSVFETQIGPSWIEEAFRTARAVDPDAKLCYNDYNTDGINAKSNAVYAMVKDLVARGVPIDCVGFQSHFNSDSPLPADYEANLQRFIALGLEVAITELDIATSVGDGLPSGGPQAASYAEATQTCLNLRGCLGITVWGVTDKYSWRAQQLPLPIGVTYDKKPAYTAMLDTLNAGLPEDTTVPTTTAAVSGTTTGGWYAAPPTITLTGSDGEGGGVQETQYQLDAGPWQRYTEPVAVTAQGAHVLRYRSVDYAGNTETSRQLSVAVDTRQPQVSYAGNTGSYLVDDTVAITCSATDPKPGSGLASSSCSSVSAPAWSLALGTNTLRSTATDIAGNTRTRAATFTVSVTYSSLRTLVTEFSSNATVAQSLNDKLTTAENATTAEARTAALNAFETQVKRQTGRALTSDQATVLIRLERGLR